MNLVYQRIIRLNSIPEPNSGCWLWTAGDEGGYGRVKLSNGFKALANRLSLAAFTDFTLNSPLNALHKCHIKLCVNPDHLYPGTQKQNIADSKKAGHFPSGKRNFNGAKTHCPKNHEYTPKNTTIIGHSRRCRKCMILSNKVRYTKELK